MSDSFCSPSRERLTFIISKTNRKQKENRSNAVKDTQAVDEQPTQARCSLTSLGYPVLARKSPRWVSQLLHWVSCFSSWCQSPQHLYTMADMRLWKCRSDHTAFYLKILVHFLFDFSIILISNSQSVYLSLLPLEFMMVKIMCACLVCWNIYPSPWFMFDPY